MMALGLPKDDKAKTKQNQDKTKKGPMGPLFPLKALIIALCAQLEGSSLLYIA